MITHIDGGIIVKRIVFTGGGSAGHVTPNIPIIKKLRSKGWDIHYIGTKDGIEHEIITKEGIEFHGIKAGKLRRYVDLKNLSDPFKVVAGVGQSFSLIRKLKPDIIFSKGGFVTVPVVLGGWLNRVKIIAHESDMTPGLANKIALPFATKICLAFPETQNYISKEKSIVTGIPIRDELLRGDKAKGLNFARLKDTKPVIMAIGGSLGSASINEGVRKILPRLLDSFQVINICGKGNIDHSMEKMEGYRQFEYVNKEISDLFAASDLIISRAGATVLFEILALKKPNIIIPLPLSQSRGDQILNAQSFEKLGYSQVIKEESLTEEALLEAIINLHNNGPRYINNMKKAGNINSTDKVVGLIEETITKKQS